MKKEGWRSSRDWGVSLWMNPWAETRIESKTRAQETEHWVWIKIKSSGYRTESKLTREDVGVSVLLLVVVLVGLLILPLGITPWQGLQSKITVMFYTTSHTDLTPVTRALWSAVCRARFSLDVGTSFTTTANSRPLRGASTSSVWAVKLNQMIFKCYMNHESCIFWLPSHSHKYPKGYFSWVCGCMRAVCVIDKSYFWNINTHMSESSAFSWTQSLWSKTIKIK